MLFTTNWCYFTWHVDPSKTLKSTVCLWIHISQWWLYTVHLTRQQMKPVHIHIPTRASCQLSMKNKCQVVKKKKSSLFGQRFSFNSVVYCVMLDYRLLPPYKASTEPSLMCSGNRCDNRTYCTPSPQCAHTHGHTFQTHTQVLEKSPSLLCCSSHIQVRRS